MLSNLTPLLVSIGATLLGLLIRASRRNRLRTAVSNYTTLSKELEDHDPETAALVRGLAAETARTLVAEEHRSFSRRLDPAGVFVLVLFVGTPVGLAIWSWTWGSGWKWLITIAAAIWSFILIAAVWDQLWKPRESEARVTSVR
jgi:hypothetical protein